MKKAESKGMPYPILWMLSFAICGALVVGTSFQVIVYWPQPVAIAPYFEDALFPTGIMWGLVVGAVVGWLIGWLTDESHFGESQY